MKRRPSDSTPTAGLHLHAVDAEDVPALSAAISSTTVKRSDMGYEAARRRFALVGNRFRWEGPEFGDGKGGSRIRAGVQINDVDRVQGRGMTGLPEDAVLELLAVTVEPGPEAPEAVLTLTFAGGAAVRLQAGCVDVLVDDMGRAWYTPNRPDHDGEDGAGD